MSANTAEVVEVDIFAEMNRANADNAAYPKAKNLNHGGATALSCAYSNGAPAALIVEAEQVAALIGPRGSAGRTRRALALARRVRSLNARLSEWFDGRCLAEVSAVGSAPAGVVAVLAEAAALIAAHRTSDRYEPERSLEPPSESSKPGLRRGPPHRAPGEVLNSCALGLSARHSKGIRGPSTST